MTEVGAMDVARSYVSLSRRKRELDAELGRTKGELEKIQARLLEHIENGDIPESFKLDGASVYTRSQLWASPRESHEALAAVLSQVGLEEYLPSTVNSHSISAYVREHVNPETGEVEGLDPRLLEALKITETTKAVVNG